MHNLHKRDYTYRQGGADWQFYVIALLLLTGVTVLANPGARILGLYQDDLYVWDVYSSHHFLDYVFLTGSSRFRPVWNFISYVIFKAVGPRTQWLVPIHLAVNGAIAWLVCWISLKFSRSRVTGLLMGIAYALSHFAYYQVSMALGMMEAFALAQVIFLLYLLIRYLDTGSGGYGAIACYFLAVFTHERYMVLIVLMAAVFAVRRDWKKLGASLAVFAAVQLIRLWAIGTISPPGTGHTTVAETFHFQTAFGYALSQVLYLFGINAGPDYLNGIPWTETAGPIKLLTAASWAVLAALCILCAWALVRSRGGRRQETSGYLGRLAVFATFIALCIGSSSVTVRVEMRWVYVSYTAALCTLAYMIGIIRENAARTAPLAAGLAAAYVLLLIPTEHYYRGHWSQMYYYQGQKEMNSLAGETWFRYGDDLFDKKIYVLENTFDIADYTWETVFRIFRPKGVSAAPPVTVIRDADELGLIGPDMVILAEDQKDHSYTDITDYVRRRKLRPEEGYYEDRWADQTCRFYVRTGPTGVLSLSGDFPAEPEGGEETRLRVKGVTAEADMDVNLPWTGSAMEWKAQLEPYQTYAITLDSNFYMKDALEKRGKKPLAFLLTVTAD